MEQHHSRHAFLSNQKRRLGCVVSSSALLERVRPVCHSGLSTCFYGSLDEKCLATIVARYTTLEKEAANSRSCTLVQVPKKQRGLTQLWSKRHNPTFQDTGRNTTTRARPTLNVRQPLQTFHQQRRDSTSSRRGRGGEMEKRKGERQTGQQSENTLHTVLHVPTTAAAATTTTAAAAAATRNLQ